MRTFDLFISHALVIITLVTGMAVARASDGNAAIVRSTAGLHTADFWDSRSIDVASAIETPTSSFALTSRTGPSGWHYEFDPNAIAAPDQRGHNAPGREPQGRDLAPRGVIDRAMPFTFTLSGSTVTALRALTPLAMSSPSSETRAETERYFAHRFDRAGHSSDVATSPTQTAPPTISEPASLILLGTGLIGLARRGWLRA